MSSLLQVQRAIGDLLLDEAPEFREDPGGWARQKGLDAADQAAIQTYAKRLWVYRELVDFALSDPLNDGFPITKALLEKEDQWDPCLRAFFAARTISSIYYRDLNPTFLAWLMESGWGSERWPFLLSLAHWEYTELELIIMPQADAPASFSTSPDPRATAVFREVRHLTYPYQVHESTEESPAPEQGETHLLAWRDADADFQSLVLSPHASALVARLLAKQPLQTACDTVGVTYDQALPLLQELRDRDVLLGFMPT
jgi:hypothetical protein